MTKRKIFVVGTLLFSISLANLTSCGINVSEKYIKESSYYTELFSKYSTLKKKYKKVKEKNQTLNEQVATLGEKTPEEIEIERLLDKLSRDSFIKVEVLSVDEIESSQIFETEVVFELAKELALQSDVFTKSNIEEIKRNSKVLYEYILYDEDNSIHEISIYEDDFIVFKDLPEQVFYSAGASRLGDAFIGREQYYPQQEILVKMFYSSLILEDDTIIDENVAKKILENFDKIEKKKLKESDIEKDIKLKKTLEFYNHGEKIVLQIYNEVFCIEDNDGKKLWYSADKKDILNMFKDFS